MFEINNRRYIGSKKKLISEIKKIINKYNYDSFLDLFGGTGIVAHNVIDQFKDIGINDILISNYVIYNAFHGKGSFSMKKLNLLKEKFNKLEGKKTFFSKIYANTYFSQEVCEKIGAIREEIEILEITDREKFILLASLLYSVDKVANTVGHYESYLHNVKLVKNFNFELINPSKFNFKIFNEDANTLVKKVSYDVVYIDPPYNSRQYSRFYHLLETIVFWKNFEPQGKAKKPPLSNLSNYCTTKATESFDELISSISAKLIIVSYNNTYSPKSNSAKNKIAKEDLEKILKKKGRLKIFEYNHNFFNSGKTFFENHKEYLYVCEVE